jgi:hypothetical protein
MRNPCKICKGFLFIFALNIREMTNSDLFSLYKLLLRKNGISEPQDAERFELLLQQENMSYFKELATSYSKDQDIADSLSPFESQVQVSTLTITTTTIDVPTDYARFIAMYHTDDDGYVRPFDLVTDEQWDMRLMSTITVPSVSYPICKVVSNKIYVNPVLDQISFTDWFLPELDVLLQFYNNLKAYGIGGFNQTQYWSSSEDSSTVAYVFVMLTGIGNVRNKTGTYGVRACRTFTDSVGAYSLRDTGPAGGYIGYIAGTTCYEVAPSDQSTGRTWSNVTAAAVGTTSTAIGTGQANTTAIINQAGHTDSAAKLCDDLIVTI